MEWSDARMLQLIELYEKRPYLCNIVTAWNWTITAYATLSRDFVACSRNKIARENCRCDINLTLSLIPTLAKLCIAFCKLYRLTNYAQNWYFVFLCFCCCRNSINIIIQLSLLWILAVCLYLLNAMPHSTHHWQLCIFYCARHFK